jgi:predicted nucleotidyltransferase
MAEAIAARVDSERFGVQAIYLTGSTKSGTAAPFSDIDLIVHFSGTERQREDLLAWLDGWSQCLDELNFLQTGCRQGKLLDVHIVTERDITQKTSFAAKIGASTDAARRLPLGRRDSDQHT